MPHNQLRCVNDDDFHEQRPAKILNNLLVAAEAKSRTPKESTKKLRLLKILLHNNGLMYNYITKRTLPRIVLHHYPVPIDMMHRLNENMKHNVHNVGEPRVAQMWINQWKVHIFKCHFVRVVFPMSWHSNVESNIDFPYEHDIQFPDSWFRWKYVIFLLPNTSENNKPLEFSLRKLSIIVARLLYLVFSTEREKRNHPRKRRRTPHCSFW